MPLSTQIERRSTTGAPVQGELRRSSSFMSAWLGGAASVRPRGRGVSEHVVCSGAQCGAAALSPPPAVASSLSSPRPEQASCRGVAPPPPLQVRQGLAAEQRALLGTAAPPCWRTAFFSVTFLVTPLIRRSAVLAPASVAVFAGRTGGARLPPYCARRALPRHPPGHARRSRCVGHQPVESERRS